MFDKKIGQLGIIVFEIHAAAIRMALHIVVCIHMHHGPIVLKLVKDNDSAEITIADNVALVNRFTVYIVQTDENTFV